MVYDSDSLQTTFTSLLDSIGFSLLVNEPTHNHTLGLVLTYGLENDNLLAVTQNSIFSEHSLITFDFAQPDQTAHDRKVYYKIR